MRQSEKDYVCACACINYKKIHENGKYQINGFGYLCVEETKNVLARCIQFHCTGYVFFKMGSAYV